MDKTKVALVPCFQRLVLLSFLLLVALSTILIIPPSCDASPASIRIKAKEIVDRIVQWGKAFTLGDEVEEAQPSRRVSVILSPPDPISTRHTPAFTADKSDATNASRDTKDFAFIPFKKLDLSVPGGWSHHTMLLHQYAVQFIFKCIRYNDGLCLTSWIHHIHLLMPTQILTILQIVSLIRGSSIIHQAVGHFYRTLMEHIKSEPKLFPIYAQLALWHTGRNIYRSINVTAPLFVTYSSSKIPKHDALELRKRYISITAELASFYALIENSLDQVLSNARSDKSKKSISASGVGSPSPFSPDTIRQYLHLRNLATKAKRGYLHENRKFENAIQRSPSFIYRIANQCQLFILNEAELFRQRDVMQRYVKDVEYLIQGSFRHFHGGNVSDLEPELSVLSANIFPDLQRRLWIQLIHRRRLDVIQLLLQHGLLSDLSDVLAEVDHSVPPFNLLKEMITELRDGSCSGGHWRLVFLTGHEWTCSHESWPSDYAVLFFLIQLGVGGNTADGYIWLEQALSTLPTLSAAQISILVSEASTRNRRSGRAF